MKIKIISLILAMATTIFYYLNINIEKGLCYYAPDNIARRIQLDAESIIEIRNICMKGYPNDILFFISILTFSFLVIYQLILLFYKKK